MVSDSSMLSNNNNLIVKGYKLVRDDHPDDVKRGGLCAFIKDFLPVRFLFNTYLKECLNLEVCIKNIKGYVTSLYRSPSHRTN